MVYVCWMSNVEWRSAGVGGGGEHTKAASRISGVGCMDTQYTKVCSLRVVFLFAARGPRGGGVWGTSNWACLVAWSKSVER